MKYEALMFDLDGTLWNATDNILKSWNLAIKEFDKLKDRELTDKELQSVMGMPMDKIAEILFPEIPEEERLEVLEKCCEIEDDYLNKNGGILYPKLVESLKELKKTHKLFIVSNGQAGYVQSFLNSHNLWDYFDDIQNWGDNKVSKGENIKVVLERNNIKKAAYIGDTQGDADSAAYAGIDFIYARYGFGNVEKYKYAIDNFYELTELEL